MKAHIDRTAEWYCTHFNCEEGEELLCGKNEIRNAKQRAIRHHKKTGHCVHFIVSTISTYGKELVPPVV